MKKTLSLVALMILSFRLHAQVSFSTSWQTSIPGFSGGASVFPVDVNGDGKLDLICLTPQTHFLTSVTVFTNDGSGSFDLAFSIYISELSYVKASYVNGDNSIDLIVGSTSGTSVYTNDGIGDFTLDLSPFDNKAEYFDYSSFFELPLDINGDGFVDSVSLEIYLSSTILVSTNNGSGGFVSACSVTGIFSSPQNGLTVIPADLNQDGKVDLICVGGGGTGTGQAISVLTNATQFPPASLSIITTEPTNQINPVGDATTFSVGATIARGPQLFSYQWYNNSGIITGATNAILVLHDAQIDTNNYWAVVSNTFGSVTSSVASVLVGFSPSVSTQPLPQTVTAGTPVNLSVTVKGTPPLYYQWFDSMGAIQGATNSSYLLNPAQTNNWDNYFVLVNNSFGAITSAVTPLVVYGPVTVNSEPNNQIVTLGATASFFVSASGFPPPVYQWTFSGTNLPGAASNTLTISNVDLPNLGNYQALINNGYSISNSYVVTLNMSPSFVSPFTGATTIWGKGATVSVGVVGSGTLNYQWFFNGVPITGANGDLLNFTSIQFTNAGLYSVVVSSPFGSLTNAAYELVVNPANVAIGFYPGLTIGGVEGYSYVIQSSTNLANENAWTTLTNLTLTKPVELWVDTNVDASSPFNSKTFYKVLPGQ